MILGAEWKPDSIIGFFSLLCAMTDSMTVQYNWLLRKMSSLIDLFFPIHSLFISLLCISVHSYWYIIVSLVLLKKFLGQWACNNELREVCKTNALLLSPYWCSNLCLQHLIIYGN